MIKLQKSGLETQLSSKEKSIYTIIQSRPNIQSGEISEKLAIPAPTVKRILSELLKKGLIEKQGKGRNVSYTVNNSGDTYEIIAEGALNEETVNNVKQWEELKNLYGN
ncbi:hypothetical protein ADIS_0063 [Lunatimonas lonarensis]|uniref:HTH marR-type domain-containing protein n=1 Tax=Lunatimonas lonarensis TaxID=1232681 RepID=R7ZZH4_9BACT|nr:winged helix-turn-helix transcriptional regulator [Lunatimonas lonarensis]EON79496.1 hypothetical protein ADIS_0063 [Lunatimonas lonarensis]